MCEASNDNRKMSDGVARYLIFWCTVLEMICGDE